MNAYKDLQKSFSDLLNASSVKEIEGKLNLFSSKTSNKKCLYKLGGYLRLSPSVDDPRDEGSLKNHPYHIVNYVNRKNSEKKDWGAIREWYVDSEVSAATLDRPAFKRLLQDLDSGKINGFVVYDLLRASRDTLDFLMVVEFLQKRRISFFSTCEQIDFDSPFGRYMATLRVAGGQFERETNIFRLKKGAMARAQRGLAHNCPTLGYDPIEYKTHHIQINKAEAEEVKFHFSSFLKPEIKNLRQWLEFVNEKGYKTKRYRTKKGEWRGGNRWTITTAHNFFTNKIYIAIREYNKRNRDVDQAKLTEEERYFCVPGNWEAIIEPETFGEVAKKLKSNRKKKRQYKRDFPLSKLVHCSECGAVLVGDSGTSRDGSKHYYYGHMRKMITKNDRHLHRCKVEKIRALEIETVAINKLRTLSSNRKLLEEIAKRSRSLSAQSLEDKKGLLNSREQERRKIVQEQENCLKALGETSSSEVQKLILKSMEKHAAHLERLEIEMSSMKKEIQNNDNLLDLSGVFGVLKKFNRDFDKLPANEKSEVLASIIKRIILSPNQISMELYGAKVEPIDLRAKKNPTKKLPLGANVLCSDVVLNGRGERI